MAARLENYLLPIRDAGAGLLTMLSEAKHLRRVGRTRTSGARRSLSPA